MLCRLASSAACLLLLFTVGPTADAGSVYSDLVIDNTSPVIYWDLNETAGPTWPPITTANDLVPIAGGANIGTYHRVELNNAGPRPSDGYLNMDSANAAPRADWYGEAVEYTSLNTTAGVGTAAYSAQVWFNSSEPFTGTALNYFFGRGNSGDTRDQVLVSGTSLSVPNRLYFINATSGGPTILEGTTDLAPDTWYHMLLVRDNEDINVYLNGQPDITGTASWLGGTGDYLSIANRSDFVTATGNGLRGLVDEVAVWDRALTSQEALNLYEYATTGSGPAPVPEPATWGLALIGVLFLLPRYRKRR